MNFECLECGATGNFDDEDPTNSKGACRVCGSHKWMEWDDRPSDKFCSICGRSITAHGEHAAGCQNGRGFDPDFNGA